MTPATSNRQVSDAACLRIIAASVADVGMPDTADQLRAIAERLETNPSAEGDIKRYTFKGGDAIRINAEEDPAGDWCLAKDAYAIAAARAALRADLGNTQRELETWKELAQNAEAALRSTPSATDVLKDRLFCLEDALRPFAMQADTMYHLKDDEKVCGMYVAWFRYAAKMMEPSST